MRISPKILGALVLISALSSCKTIEEHRQEMGWKTGQTYSGTFNASRFDVPLPEGEWVLGSTQLISRKTGRKFEDADFFQMGENNTTKSFLEIVSTDPSGGGHGYAGWSPSYACDPEEALHAVSKANYQMEQNCWYMRAVEISGYDDVKNSAGEVTANLVQQRNADADGWYFVTIHHFADREYYFRVYHISRIDMGAGTLSPEVWKIKSKEALPVEAKTLVQTAIQRETAYHDQLDAVFN